MKMSWFDGPRQWSINYWRHKCNGCIVARHLLGAPSSSSPPELRRRTEAEEDAEESRSEEDAEILSGTEETIGSPRPSGPGRVLLMRRRRRRRKSTRRTKTTTTTEPRPGRKPRGRARPSLSLGIADSGLFFYSFFTLRPRLRPSRSADFSVHRAQWRSRGEVDAAIGEGSGTRSSERRGIPGTPTGHLTLLLAVPRSSWHGSRARGHRT